MKANIYIDVALGWALGMMLVIAVQAAIIHQSGKHDDDFITALRKYVTTKVGPLVVAVVMMLIALFVIPEIIANSNVENGQKSPFYYKYLSSVLMWLKSWSILFGIGSQTLGFIIVFRVLKYVKKNGGSSQ